MPFTELEVGWLAATVPLWPLLAFLVLGGVMLVHRTPSERTVARWVLGALWLSLGCSVVTAASRLLHHEDVLEVEVGRWFSAGDYSFLVSLFVDRLSATMMVLTSAITLLIGWFSVNYLHREPGFARFFLLLALFATGMLLLVESGSIDLLFVGWELVGLTSALLIGFFHERATPVRSGLRAFTIYRLCDMGLLVGAVLLHHFAGSAEWADALGERAWPGPAVALGVVPATVLALCLMLAAMGKSAQLPFSSWLPRAMEGPTPSSALFYGALSVHAGLYLLLRVAPLLESAPVARAALVIVGLLTAVHATLVWRVQTDVKSSLAYGVLTQVGLMFAEVGLGLYRLALVHLVAHACLRCLQLLRAPSALREVQARRAALRAAKPPSVAVAHQVLPEGLLRRFYRLALERFSLEVLHERWAMGPLLRGGQWMDRMERRWVGALSGWMPRNEPTLPQQQPEMRPAEQSSGGQSTGAV
ncbi:NADH-quinone oxidoreductase subunit L [Vitiosangium sp. GDMCC 1.1324]|uniref:NADH-quinone oxidoreductase subunit 5 family protein n=1 Tax=Vitiosangium sp. (strain GDMCC 1.1324) TaxID=2138576 RepID=UPI000D399895|nr:proton-conducting transporter membrane subunit [Vitiosangium sp. GDMCC 1.1324]PTL76029.1 proton-conducting membrane transporter [Vitiosangium sp. GDMCC 1.1324]